MLREDLVVHGHRADDAAQPALERAAQAQQPDHVACVRVVGQVGVGLVPAHVDVAVRPAVVVDVAEEVALRVLVERGAQVAAEAPQDQADVLVAIAIDRQAAEQHDAAAAVDLVEHLPQPRRHRREREVLAVDVGQRAPAGPGHAERAVDLGELGLAPGDDPGLVAGELGAAPGLRPLDRGGADRSHRRRSPWVGSVPGLARGRVSLARGRVSIDTRESRRALHF